ncbi:hypothetical protein JNO48_03720 [Clostridiales bacterium]|nr:hypothetical protein JNO48_03720 [Clostridiales bacterium]
MTNKVRSVLGRVLQFLVVTAGIFAWWMAVLLLVSVFTVNIWHIAFTSIVFISLGLTGICAAVYLAVMLRRARPSGGA